MQRGLRHRAGALSPADQERLQLGNRRNSRRRVAGGRPVDEQRFGGRELGALATQRGQPR